MTVPVRLRVVTTAKRGENPYGKTPTINTTWGDEPVPSTRCKEMTRQDDTTDTLSKHGGSLCYKEYDYEIVYVQGKFNVVADALSMINESPSTALYVRIR
jgi:hypothetical protein